MAETTSNVISTVEAGLLKKYGDTATPVLTALKHLDYTDEALKKTPVYNMQQDTILSKSQIAALGGQLRQVIASNFSDSSSLNLILLLARNVRKPEDTDKVILSPLNWTSAETFTLAGSGVRIPSEASSSANVPASKLVEPPEEEMVAEADKTFTAPPTENMSKVDADQKVASALDAHRRSYITAEKLRVAKHNKAIEDQEREMGNTKSAEVSGWLYWPFLAGYILKQAIKSPENVKLGVLNMKERYKSFYDQSVVPECDIPTEALSSLQYKLKSANKLMHTWVGMGAQCESDQKMEVQSAGVIRFLINIQFGFHGMHGYSLFREVLIATRWSTGTAIMKLWMSPTSSALDLINTIINNYESTIKENVVTNRDTYFKYARFFNPQYFLALQPSQCLALLYLCSKILNHHVKYAEISNPLRMFALSKLGTDQAEYLDTFVETLIMDDNQDTSQKTALEIRAAERHREKKMEKEQGDAAAERNRLAAVLRSRAGLT
ncbi:TPA_asm: N [Glycyrrhiza betacytorhabdovirus 1]|nr:TPA_asm: N [Glycyrrhiza betacytorhabdovirus 1]